MIGLSLIASYEVIKIGVLIRAICSTSCCIRCFW